MARAERTVKMFHKPNSELCLFMTLDVSKLSAWLNADAPCRRGACDAGKGAAREA